MINDPFVTGGVELWGFVSVHACANKYTDLLHTVLYIDYTALKETVKQEMTGKGLK